MVFFLRQTVITIGHRFRHCNLNMGFSHTNIRLHGAWTMVVMLKMETRLNIPEKQRHILKYMYISVKSWWEPHFKLLMVLANAQIFTTYCRHRVFVNSSGMSVKFAYYCYVLTINVVVLPYEEGELAWLPILLQYCQVKPITLSLTYVRLCSPPSCYQNCRHFEFHIFC